MCHVPKTSEFYVLHFLLHGIHHAFPQDKHRLVLPPVMGFILYTVFFKWVTFDHLPADIEPAVMIGWVFGLVFYDLTHYFIHHSNPPEGSYFKMMKMYHIQHHYNHGEEGFGITSKLWDRIFGTEVKMVDVK